MANMKKTKRNILAIAGVSGMVLGIVLIIPSFMQEKYAIAIFSAIVRGLDIDCGCFKNGIMAGKAGWKKFFEDILMIIMGIQIFFSQSSFLSIEEILKNRKTKSP